MVTTLNRSDACKFANYVTDLIESGELKKSKDDKYWVTHDHFDNWLADETKLIHRQQLISFGLYLFSEERKEKYSNHPELEKNFMERLSTVHKEDIDNWLESQKPS